MKKACSPDGPPAKRRLDHRSGMFTLRQQACRGYLKTFVREGESTDITKFVTQIFPELVDLMEVELEEHQYKAVLVFHVEMVKELVNGQVKKEEAYFRSRPVAVLHSSDIPDAIRDAHSQVSPYAACVLSIVLYLHIFVLLVVPLCADHGEGGQVTKKGSGWTVGDIIDVHLHVARYEPLHGSTYLPLPDYLRSKKAIVNVQNRDDKCFMWALLSALHPANREPQRVSKYTAWEEELDFSGVTFPVAVKDIAKTECLNNLAINVFG